MVDTAQQTDINLESGSSPSSKNHSIWHSSVDAASPGELWNTDKGNDKHNGLYETVQEDGKPNVLYEQALEKVESEPERVPGAFEKRVEKVQECIRGGFEKRRKIFRWIFYGLLVLLYHAYFIVALIHSVHKAIPLIVFTAIGWTFAFYYCLYRPYLASKVNSACAPGVRLVGKVWNIKHVKWVTYGGITLAVITFLAVDTADNRYRLVSLVGLFAYIVLCFVFSTNPARVNWRPVLWGLFSQLLIGLLVLRWPPGLLAFQWLSDQIVKFLDYTYVGTNFVFGFLSQPPNICGMSPVLMFAVFQVIVFFGSVVAVLYYYGIIQWILIRTAKAMEYTMGTTAAESLFAASCVFLGQSEAAVLVRPYMIKMTRSEFHQMMTSGFACIAGSLFAAYISFGACPLYLLSASIMSAPASLAASKLLYPETEKSQTKRVADLKLPKGEESNVIEAIANGATSVVEIIVYIGANLIVFLAAIAFLNNVVEWLGEMVGIEGLTFELIYSYVFFPLAFLMGASDSPIWERKVEETMAVAELIGTKTILNEFIAYKKMGDFVVQGRIGGRAQMIATYALCGFSNIGSIGIQIACFAGLCPERKHIIPQIALRSLVAGSVACFITACFAGLLVSTPVLCNPAMQSANCFNVSAHI